MNFERTAAGLEATLKPRGAGRFVTAAFLLVWLTGWVFGEVFAAGMLLAGFYSLVTGQPFAGQPDPLVVGPALLAGLLLVLWLLLWTLGGYMAARELLRSVASEDRFVLRCDGLTVRHRIGPFRSVTSIPRADLLRVYAIPLRRRVMAETTSGSVELTSLARDCGPLIDTIRRELELPDHPAPREALLPGEWREARDSDGSTLLIQGERHRPAQARVAWGITLVVAVLAVLTLEHAGPNPESREAAMILAAITAWFAWGSRRLGASRLEWKLEAKRLRYRRRFRSGVLEIFEGRTLELVESRDSDGDPWFTLYAVAPGPRTFGWRRPLSSWQLRRTIDNEIEDATSVRRLGDFIAARTGLRLEERRE